MIAEAQKSRPGLGDQQFESDAVGFSAYRRARL